VNNRSPVAQSVEQEAVNFKVVGSSPTGGAIIIKLSCLEESFVTELIKFLDSNFLQTVVTGVLAYFAYRVAKQQNFLNKRLVDVQDTVELHAAQLIMTDEVSKAQKFYIALQNIGARVLYIDSYIFNGRKYSLGGHVLASTYSNTLANYYQIELPSNGENHISLSVSYHDMNGEKWKSSFEADLKDGWGWVIGFRGKKSN
jgi:hypothetical protein